MDPFRNQAFYILLWQSILAAIVATVLMATLSDDVAAAVLIGAKVAFLYSLGLVAWAALLTDELVVRSRAWRLLRSDQRPAGPGGRRGARRCLNEAAFGFAEAASVVAILLSVSALVLASA